MSSVLYTSLEIDSESKSKLENLAKSLVSKAQFCFLKRKGGIVTDKAHLTLDFGINISEYDRLKKDSNLEKLSGLELKVEKLEIFRLARCDALVLRVSHPELAKYHTYFKQSYKHAKNVKSNSFKPHITLAYIKPGAALDKSVALPQNLKVDKAIVKIFGPRIHKN